MNVSTSVSGRTGHSALTQSHDSALLLLLYSAHPGAMQILRADHKKYDQNINISHPRLVAVVGLHRVERRTGDPVRREVQWEPKPGEQYGVTSCTRHWHHFARRYEYVIF
jgi:hypothetical protein